MARGDRRDLFLSIGGNVSGLQAASKAGRTALLELANGADDVQAEVTKALDAMGANAPNAAKQIEQSYNKTFEAIRRNAQAVLAAPNTGARLQIIDAAAAEQAALKAEQLAVQLRLEATAAATVAQRAGEAGAAQRVLAVAMETNAQTAENEAVALRQQANVLGAVRDELGLMGAAQRRVSAASGQQGNSLFMVGQQLQDFSIQVAAGQSALTAFAQQIGQTAFAVQGMGGKMAGVASFLTSVWGVAAVTATTVLVPLVAKLLEGDDALQKQIRHLKENADEQAVTAQANRIFAGTQEGLEARIRDTTKAIDAQNTSLRTNAELQNINAQSEYDAAQKNLTAAQASLAAARARQKTAPQGLAAADPRIARAAGVDSGTLSQAVQDASDAVAKAQKDVNDSFIALNKSRVFLAAEQATAESTQIGKITKEYDGRIRAVKRAAIADAEAGKQIGAATKQRILDLEKEKKAKIDAIQSAASESTKASRAAQQEARAAAREALSEAKAQAKLIASASTAAYKATADLVKDRDTNFLKGFAVDAGGWDKIAEQAANMHKAQQQTELETEQHLQRVRETNVRTLAGLYEDLFAGGTRDLWRDFEHLGLMVISRLLAEWTVSKLGSSGGGGILGDVLGLLGGASFFAEGGVISGPGTGTSDSILARVSAGEGILTAATVGYYGPDIVAMLNERRLPRFASGGVVGVPSRLSYPRLPTSAALAAGGAGGQRLQVDAKVQVDASPLLDARMQDISVRTVGAAAEPIMAGAQSRTIKRLSRPSLPGGLG